MKTLKFDLFGRELHLLRRDDTWQAFYPGNEGKRRPARDIVIPRDIEESDLARYLDDLCHEWATDQHNSVKQLD
jgi:hypothetical protein